MKVRFELHGSVNGIIQREPLGFAEFEDPDHANRAVAQLLRKIADEIDPHNAPPPMEMAWPDDYGPFFRD